MDTPAITDVIDLIDEMTTSRPEAPPAEAREIAPAMATLLMAAQALTIYTAQGPVRLGAAVELSADRWGVRVRVSDATAEAVAWMRAQGGRHREYPAGPDTDRKLLLWRPCQAVDVTMWPADGVEVPDAGR